MNNSIKFKQVIPKNLTDKQIENPNSIWNSDFQFLSGHYYQIMAPSGSGKSTVIRSIIGSFKNYTGNIFLGNTCLTTSNIDELVKIRKNKIHCVFQDLQLFDGLTISENIELLYNSATDKEKTNYLLSKFEILNKSKVLASKVSHGQKQRLAITRALLGEFEWLLLDEPFSHLDNTISEVVFNETISACKKLNAGIIITSLDERFKKDEFIQVEI